MSASTGSIQGRDAFIANIASRLGRQTPMNTPPAHPFRGAPDFYKEIERSTDEKIQLFTENWSALTGKVLVVEAEEAAEKIAAWLKEIAAELQIRQVSRWEHAGLAKLGIDEALAAAGVGVVPWRPDADGAPESGSQAAAADWIDAAEAGEAAPQQAGGVRTAPHIPAVAATDALERDAQAAGEPIEAAAAAAAVNAAETASGPNWAKRSRLLRQTERCQMGIVWPDYAIANTSTLVLQCSPQQGRSVSLLTDILFAVFRADQLVTRMGEAFAGITAGKTDATQYPSSLNLITGPSRSADIENDLTIGIHGPGKVYAVIIK